MDYASKLIKTFNLEGKNAIELLQISILVDEEKKNAGFLAEDKSESAQIASIIASLMNGKSTYSIGNEIYAELSKLLLIKNKELIEAETTEAELKKYTKWDETGKFIITRTATGIRYKLCRADGEILAVSESYSSIESCVRGIKAMQNASLGGIEDQTIQDTAKTRNPKYELYLDKYGTYRFRLKAKNGEIISASMGFAKKSECIDAITEVKKLAPNALLENS